jgi:hypothetical protein
MYTVIVGLRLDKFDVYKFGNSPTPAPPGLI